MTLHEACRLATVTRRRGLHRNQGLEVSFVRAPATEAEDPGAAACDKLACSAPTFRENLKCTGPSEVGAAAVVHKEPQGKLSE